MKKKILIIDDDADYGEINRTVLESHGYSVRQAYNGKEGLEMAREEVPDLIMLDLMMEHADAGFTVAKKLKDDPITANVPILMVSAVSREMGMRFDLDSAEDRAWIKADMFLDKPIRSDELVKRVEAILGQKPQH